MQIRLLALSSSALLLLTLTPLHAHAFKWRDRRQSSNVIDIRAETRAVSLQMTLETGRRYLVAMMMTAEKDALEQPDCVTLNQEIEKLKTVRVELESMGIEPVRRLICEEESGGPRINLCARALAKDPATVPPAADLKEFEDELTGNYGPALEQVDRVRAAINAKQKALAKEDKKCRAALQLIEKKSAEMIEVYANLRRTLEELSLPNR